MNTSCRRIEFFPLSNKVAFITFFLPCYIIIFSSSNIFEVGILPYHFICQATQKKSIILLESTNVYIYFLPCLYFLLLLSAVIIYSDFKQLHSLSDASTEFKVVILHYQLLYLPD